jgi:hypothetical protein
MAPIRAEQAFRFTYDNADRSSRRDNHNDPQGFAPWRIDPNGLSMSRAGAVSFHHAAGVATRTT